MKISWPLDMDFPPYLAAHEWQACINRTDVWDPLLLRTLGRSIYCFQQKTRWKSKCKGARRRYLVLIFPFNIYNETILHRCKNVIHMTYFFQFREMLTEMRENKKAKKFTRFVPGARDGRSALEVMDNSFGGKASNLLLGNIGTVTERDKVQINQSTTNFANFRFISMKKVSGINCDIKIYF